MPVRTLVIWFPDWPVTVAAHEAGCSADAPVAVIDGGRVLACSATARAEGVRRGSRTREAQAACPDLLVFKHDQAADVRLFEPIVTAVEGFAPGVEIIQPGTCAVAASGPAGYFGGEAAMVDALGEHLGIVLAAEPIAEYLGLFHLGIADGPLAADQAARMAWHVQEESLVVEPGRSGEFLAPLPVEVLDRPELTGLLRRLGIRTLGAFAELPVRAVLTRFGADGAHAHRLAGARDERLLDKRRPPPDLTVTLRLEPAVDRIDTVAFAARAHAERLVASLAARNLVCTSLRVEVRTERPEEISRCWRHPRWFTAADVVDRIRWQLQGTAGVGAGLSAGVVRVRLVPEEADPIGVHQEGLWGDRAPEERVHRTLARVQSMLGHTAVVTATPSGGRGHLERVVQLPWGSSEKPRRTRKQPEGHRSIAAKIRAERPVWPGHLPAPAPATVLPSPLVAVVADADGNPIRVTEREVVSAPPARLDVTDPDGRTETRQVTHWTGPWVADERTWDRRTRRRRARFQLACADGTAWLVAYERNHWYLEAHYD